MGYYEEKAREFVIREFDGRVDKGGAPYVFHLFRVADRLGPDATEHERTAGLLHDSVEDLKHVTLDTLAGRFPIEVVEMVDLLSRPEGGATVMTYAQFISRIIDSRNVSANRVKLSDAEDNRSPGRIAVLPETERGIARRYDKSVIRLRRALDEFAGPSSYSGIIAGDLNTDYSHYLR
jgi:hypothetical protein